MKSTLKYIARAFIPNRVTLRVFSVFIILFFVTLKSNPVESALTWLMPLSLYKYHSMVTPYTPSAIGDTSFGSDKYCIEAPAIFSCASLYPLGTIKNIGLWYLISAPIAGIITRLKKDKKEEEENREEEE